LCSVVNVCIYLIQQELGLEGLISSCLCFIHLFVIKNPLNTVYTYVQEHNFSPNFDTKSVGVGLYMGQANSALVA